MHPFTLPLALTLVFTAGPAWSHGDHLKPQFGGITAEADAFQVELVAKGAHITLYLSEHGAPVESSGASGKLIVLSGKIKEEVTLTPSGFQTLTAKLQSRPAKGAKAVVSITVPGRDPGTARFMLK